MIPQLNESELLTRVRTIAAAQGITDISRLEQAAAAASTTPGHVRYLINNVLRIEISNADLAAGQPITQRVRGALINDGPDEEWLGLLEQVVFPHMKAQGLLT